MRRVWSSSLVGLLLLLVLHQVGLWAMHRWRIMETLLSPGGQDSWASALLALAFLCLRFTLYFFGPSLFLIASLFAFLDLSQRKEELPEAGP